jgi:hypothetical protein
MIMDGKRLTHTYEGTTVYIIVSKVCRDEPTAAEKASAPSAKFVEIESDEEIAFTDGKRLHFTAIMFDGAAVERFIATDIHSKELVRLEPELELNVVEREHL